MVEGVSASQNAKNRRDGAAFESAVVNYLRDRGLEAERLRLSGKQDEGDVTLRDKVGVAAVLELKAGKNLSVRRWYDDEAVPEAQNFANRRSMIEPPMPVLVMKSHNKSIGKALVTISLEHYLDLMGGAA